MKIVLIALLVSLSAFMPDSKAAGGRESGGRRTASAVFVNFLSPGNGIDRRTLSVAVQLINEASRNGSIKKYTKENWGREGETTICAYFQGGAHGGAAISREFIRELAPLIIADTKKQGLQRTGVYLGVSCKDIVEATEQDLAKYLK